MSPAHTFELARLSGTWQQEKYCAILRPRCHEKAYHIFRVCR